MDSELVDRPMLHDFWRQIAGPQEGGVVLIGGHAGRDSEERVLSYNLETVVEASRP